MSGFSLRWGVLTLEREFDGFGGSIIEADSKEGRVGWLFSFLAFLDPACCIETSGVAFPFKDYRLWRNLDEIFAPKSLPMP